MCGERRGGVAVMLMFVNKVYHYIGQARSYSLSDTSILADFYSLSFRYVVFLQPMRTFSKI